ncbi:MAG: peptidase S8 [Deltaproteobacteria bacterium]|nr:peptidase S8 [Deltaproteobacteria bacterium]
MKLSIATSLLLLSSPALAQTPKAQGIIVDLVNDSDDQDERALEERIGGIDLRLNSVYSRAERLFIGDVAEEDRARVLELLRGDARVEVAEPNWEVEAFGLPNDPMFEKQWSFAMVDAPSAWDVADGRGVVVAVIDTGVAFENHKSFRKVEDLAGTEFVAGYNFIDDTEHANDDHGHGTHVAGTIAQTTNNGIGVAGIAPRARIMPLKVLDRGGRGTTADIADAIRMAADEGAKVINMSLGGGGRSFVMENAVKYARSKGVFVACAAGNGSRGIVEYPAAYAGSTAVSSVGPSRKLAFYSSWGKEIALAAPGGDKQEGGELGGILQNTIEPGRVGATSTYLSYQGTSMATPHVAGAAALVMSLGVTDPAKVEQILRSTASEAGARGWDPKYGSGILNAGRAVKAARKAVGGPSHLLAALGLALLFTVKLKGSRSVGLGGLGLFAASIASAGLFFAPSLGLLSMPLAAMDINLGPAFASSALWASALPPLAFVLVLLPVKRAAGTLTGLCLGFAAHLLVSGIVMPADVALIPGFAGVLDRTWLFANAAALVGLAKLVSIERR